MSHVAPAVRLGLLQKDQFDYLNEGLVAFARDGATYGVEYARDLCEDNPLLFGHLFLGHQLLEHIIRVDDEIRSHDNVVVQLPRGFAKSVTHAMATVIHTVCYSVTGNPQFRDPRMLLLQESDTAAEFTMNSVRGTIEAGGNGRLIHAAFNIDGKTIPDRASRWAGQYIVLPDAGSTGKEPTCLAAGAGSSILGMHPKVIIFDDIVSPKNSRTPHLRQVLWELMQQNIFGTIDPGTRVISLCTPQYEGDVSDRLVKTSGFHLARRPALNRFPTMADFEPVLDEAGERVWVRTTEAGADLQSLWPCPLGSGNCPGTREHYEAFGVHRSVEWLIHDKYLREPIMFTTQYMLETTQPEGSMIPASTIRFFSRDAKVGGKAVDNNGHEIVLLPSADEIVAGVHSWDHAIGKKRRNDQTSVSFLYRDKKKRVFSSHVMGRWDFPTAVRKMDSYYATDPVLGPVGRKPAKIVTEGIGFQEAFGAQAQQQSLTILPIVVEKDPVDKATALAESGLVTAMMSGHFFIEWEDKEVLKQYLMFGPEGRYHDDGVDSDRLGFKHIRNPVEKPIQVFHGSRRSRFAARRSGTDLD